MGQEEREEEQEMEEKELVVIWKDKKEEQQEGEEEEEETLRVWRGERAKLGRANQTPPIGNQYSSGDPSWSQSCDSFRLRLKEEEVVEEE